VWCGASVLQVWCKHGVSVVRAERFCVQAPPDSFSLSCSLGTDTRKSRQRKRESQDRETGTYVGISVTDRQTDRGQNKEVLASGVPPKG
jgi:hypothetical protein